jgi:hypothetical protein
LRPDSSTSAISVLSKLRLRMLIGARIFAAAANRAVAPRLSRIFHD